MAILRDKMWEKMEQSGLTLIDLPEKSYPERTVTVSSRIPKETQDKIAAALLSPEGQKAAASLLKRFKKDKFIPAQKQDYDGLDKLLKPVWGFR